MISPYNFIYEVLTEEQRIAIGSDISRIIEKSIEENIGLFKKGVEQAVTKMYENVIVNPWVDYVKENTRLYDFIETIKDALWNEILKSNPSKVNKYELRQIIEAWKANYPEEYQKEINREYVEKAEHLDKKLKELSLKIINY